MATNGNLQQNASRFCTKCGAQLKENARFCMVCGADSAPVAYANANAIQHRSKRKTPIAAMLLISVLVIGGLTAGGLALAGKFKAKEAKPTPGQTTAEVSGTTRTTAENTPTGTVAGQIDSALVSSGVHSSDLGNIMNGQYYFATDDLVFYSCFDSNDKAHIYSVKKDGSELRTILDGFGWSLVVIEDWLYFTGNQGEAIDGTYNIFRMKFDGSQLEQINNVYSYGMFFYDDYLYYMKSNSETHDLMSICRSSLDGKNEEVLFPDGYAPLIYKNQLYYYDRQGNMYRTKPDGADPEVIQAAAVKSYALSNEKIIYSDSNNNIYSCDLDGSNNQLIRNSQGVTIYNVNAYDGRIFFTEYDTDFNYTAYGYNYAVKSCKFDGSDEKTVFESLSYGFYMNLVSNKLMLMDYAVSESTGKMAAVIKVMNLDGSNQNTMAR